MRDALRAGRVTRRYRALVAGRLEGAIEITTPIAHHPRNPRKMVVVDPASIPGINHDLPGSSTTSATASISARYRSSPRTAISAVEPLSYHAGFTLVQVTPRTGNRHQIRVHLASIGHPIAGDDLYGGPPLANLEHGRFWLHLTELEFDSPAHRSPAPIEPKPLALGAEPSIANRVRVIAPLAPDLESAIK